MSPDPHRSHGKRTGLTVLSLLIWVAVDCAAAFGADAIEQRAKFGVSWPPTAFAATPVACALLNGNLGRVLAALGKIGVNRPQDTPQSGSSMRISWVQHRRRIGRKSLNSPEASWPIGWCVGHGQTAPGDRSRSSRPQLNGQWALTGHVGPTEPGGHRLRQALPT